MMQICTNPVFTQPSKSPYKNASMLLEPLQFSNCRGSVNILRSGCDMTFLDDPYGNLTVLRPEARVGSSGSGERKFLGWNVPPEELQFIPEHWLTQYEPEKSFYKIYINFITYVIL
uniref:Uncharacterized protein n=1 Tax=Megaselia scalaris TaxID=36166 RepID=T1GUX4_MEGSC